MNVIQSIDPAFVLVCCCVLLCTHLRDPVPHFRRHPFSDYGLASVCVCVCVCVCVYVCLFMFAFGPAQLALGRPQDRLSAARSRACRGLHRAAGAACPPGLAELFFPRHSVACLSSLGPTILFSMFSAFPMSTRKCVCVCASVEIFLSQYSSILSPTHAHIYGINLSIFELYGF